MKTNNGSLYRQWTAAIIATISLFMMGMFLGWPSPVLQKITSPTSEVYLTSEQTSWMVSVLYIGSTLSPIPTGWMANCLGRKMTFMVLASVAITSWLFLVAVQSPFGIYTARFLGGMWGGSAYTIAPIYLCEITEPRVRGAINALFTLLAYCGIMFEYCIGPHVSFTLLSILSALVPISFVIVLIWIPESPYYYLMKNNMKGAGTALMWLRCKDNVTDVEEELTGIERSVILDMQNKGTFRDLVSTPANRRALLIVEMAAILQRMSGISVIMAYASTAIPQTPSLTSNDCAIILCFVWIVFGVVSTLLVDRLGRRPLLAVSCAGCGIATGLLAAWFYLQANEHFPTEKYTLFPLACFIMYGIFFPIGLGCVPSMVQGEMFPANTRSLASGVTSTIISLTSFITNKMYQSIGDCYGLYLNYIIFSVSSFYGVYFSLSTLLETRGKTLQEIQIELSESVSKADTITESVTKV